MGAEWTQIDTLLGFNTYTRLWPSRPTAAWEVHLQVELLQLKKSFTMAQYQSLLLTWKYSDENLYIQCISLCYNYHIYKYPQYFYFWKRLKLTCWSFDALPVSSGACMLCQPHVCLSLHTFTIFVPYLSSHKYVRPPFWLLSVSTVADTWRMQHFSNDILICTGNTYTSHHCSCAVGNISDPVLQFLMTGLQQPQLATAAANSLQNISSQCRDQMTNHFSGLLQIVQAVDSFSVSNEAAIGLLKGIYSQTWELRTPMGLLKTAL